MSDKAPFPATSHRWLVSHIGSREIYACPLSFQRQGTLRCFYTDAWTPRFRKILARMPNPIWGLARRYHSGLPADKVVGFSMGTLAYELQSRLQRKSHAANFLYFNRFGEWFAKKVAARIARLELDPARDIHLAFSTGALESLRMAKQRGIPAILDQLDPARVDEDMIQEECARWEGWDAMPGKTPQEYYDRLAKEWQAADQIIVNSNFSKQAIHKQGVPLSKLYVVPLAYEAETPPTPRRVTEKSQPLHVLWLGQIVLRKGIPYLFEAARLLRNQNVKFTVAGRIGISEMALQSAPPNVNVVGRVTRERAVELYQTADVFVLPTISDGFAITQLEAMSYGLPVITTPNCGDVVTEGADGYIIPIRNPQALADAIVRLEADRDLLYQMSIHARAKSTQFTLDRYASTIERATAELVTGRQK